MLGLHALSEAPPGTAGVAEGSGPAYSVASIGQVTQFGVPAAVWDQLAAVSGFTPVLFGTPTGHQHWNVVWGTPATRFGTPSTPTDRAQDVSGLRTGGFGTPLGIRRNLPNTERRGSVTGAMATRFGTPRAGWLQTGQATGFTSAHLGTPNGVRVQTAVGFTSGQFGTAVMTLCAHAPGFMPVHLGTPVAQITQPVAGFANTVRWGLASAERSRTYKTYSFATTRFGQPTGFSRLNRPATGFIGGSFGAPTCHQRHRVLAVPPCVRLGTPLLKRITQC